MRTRVVAVLVGVVATQSGAQETTGDIRGRLLSPNDRPVPGASVIASSPNLLGSRSARSADDGVFQVLGLPPGLYTLRVARIGFVTVVVDSVRVRLGRTEGLGDITLQPSAAQLTEVRVQAPIVTLDPARTTMGATLEAAEYASLPAERDYKSIMSILPHANVSYHGDAVNVGGATGLENMYYIDGVNVTSPVGAASGIALPWNFVRSVEVRSGGYEARYGRSLGAIVNAVTYTGTNEFETSVFAFGTHDALSADSKSLPMIRESDAVSYDAGIRLSGPLVRDRAWFSAAWNPRVTRADKSVTGIGTFTDERRAQVFAGRLSWQPRAVTNVELSIFGDPTTHAQVRTLPWLTGLTPLNADTYLWNDRAGGVATSVRASTTLGGSLTLEGMASRVRIVERKAGATARGRNEPLYVDYLAGTIEGGVGIFDESKQSSTRFTLGASWQGGVHAMAGGMEYHVANSAGTFLNPGLGYIERQLEQSYAVYKQAVDGTVKNCAPAAYLQDSWRASERLTLNAGLRWSRQALVGASGRTAQRFEDEWQPRVGFSWQLDTEGRHRVLGSWGRFYLLEPLALASGYYVDYYGREFRYSVDPRTPGAAVDAENDFSASEAAYQQVDGLSVENMNELSVGYERLLGAAARLTIRGVRRGLRSTFQQAINPDTQFVLGTPGKGELSFLPAPRREYTALETSIDGSWRDLRYRASYVLSRTFGNYTGLYSSDGYVGNPGNNGGFGIWHQAKYSTGLLPNDRPHVFKLSGAWRASDAVETGVVLSWMSGTPLNRFGAGPFGYPRFLAPRGSVGRTPSVMDLNLRASYRVAHRSGNRTRLIFDLMHVGNPQGAVRQDLIAYRAEDAYGHQTAPNLDYLRPVLFQPPMMARIGIEFGR